MALDLVIRGGTIIDGTGAPRYQADVAVAQGKIVEVGKVREGAERVIDGAGLMVAPGFIDPHTHYDAQICWDPLITCSSWHGVTTVVMGNCGVGLAPCKPAERDVAAWNLVHVEAIPYDVLNQGITWDWETFPDYMNAAQRRGLGINVGFLAALSPFRHYAMGEEAMSRAATEAETAQIRAMLRDTMAAGAFGFSLTVMPQHVGYKGQPLACRLASNDELRTYANVLREAGHGIVEIALTRQPSGLSDQEYALLDLLSGASQRPVTWLNLRDRDDAPEAWTETLTKAAPLLQRGCRPQVAARPLIIEFNLRNPFLFGSMNSMKPAFGERSVEELKNFYAGADFRRTFSAELGRRAVLRDIWDRAKIKEATKPSMKALEWKSVNEVAAERGVDPVDVFFDLSIEDDLNLTFMMPILDINEERVARKFSDPRTMIGISDGGAHVDMLCNAGYPTYLIGNFVRGKQALTLEHAVKRITSEPARFFGMRDRGELRPGLAADVTIFDFDRINSPERPEVRNDFPGGGRRLVTQAQGIEYTIVNGNVLYDRGEHTGALPGQVLRSGQATA
ncbi:MAG TPA: amidohydrolase family protein [Candidatus Binataceae bacterium]|nr:amidohydrolase family protein [Candidatus Binataceae bacterium]